MTMQTALFSRRQPGGVFTIADIEQHPRNVWFVDSGHAAAVNSTGAGRNPDRPLATVAYAFSSDLVGAGDVVYVMPGHTETIAAAGGITADIAGVQVIGLGWGTSRPLFTWSATDSTIAVSASSVTFKNIRCTISIDEVVSMWNITGTYVTLDAVDFEEYASGQAIQFLLTTNAADYLTVKNCFHEQITAPAANSKWIQLVGCQGVRILNNTFHLVFTNAAASITISGSTAVVGAIISGNHIVQRGGTTQVSAILLVDSSTGSYVSNNRVACTATAITTVIDVGNAGYAGGNFAQNDPDTSGIATVPGADS